MTDRHPKEILDDAIIQYIKDTEGDVGISGDWVVVTTRQILNPDGSIANTVITVPNTSAPDYRTIGLLETALIMYRVTVERRTI